MNYSSEAPDFRHFRRVGFPFVPPDNPLPPIFTAPGCERVCTSTISQDDADACAAIQAWLCVHTGPGPGGNPLTPVFYNDSQTCGFPCPDGSTFFWTVLAGFVVTGNQDLSNRIAAEIACERAAQRHLCLPSLNEACLNDEFSQTITITSGVPPLVYTITAGSLPPGITMTQTDSRTVVFAGTPTSAGSFPFTLTVQDPDGNYMSKAYVFQVLGITPTTLPDGNKGTAYNHALSGIGGQGPYTFELELGDLPDGLTLADNGTISGTPTANGTFDFTVSVSDSLTGLCLKDYSIKIAAGCVDWTQMKWGFSFGGAVIITQGDGVATFTPNNTKSDVFNGHVSATNPFLDVNGAATENDANMVYTGPACNAKLHLDISAFTAVACQGGGLNNFNGSVDFRINGVPTVTAILCAGGVFDFPFAVPDGTSIPVTLYVNVILQTTDQAVGNVNVTVQGQFINV